MDYQDLVDAEVADMVAEAMKTPQSIYDAGIQDLTMYLVKVGRERYTLDEALILAAITDEPADALDILKRCRDVIKLELSCRSGLMAQARVDARLDASNFGPSWDDFAGAMA